MSFDYSSLSVEQLKEEKSKIEDMIVQKENELKDNFLKEVKQKADDLGIDLNELLGKNKKSKSKVTAKYQNPNKPSETWSGRGRKPAWLSNALEAGKNLEDFKIGDLAHARPVMRITKISPSESF